MTDRPSKRRGPGRTRAGKATSIGELDFSSGTAPPSGNGRSGRDEAADASARSDEAGDRRIGQILLERGLVDADQLDEALRRRNGSGRGLGATLTELGALTEQDVAEAVAHDRGVPFVDVATIDIDADAVVRLSESDARAWMAVPVEVDADGTLHVVGEDPTDELRARVAEVVGGPVRLSVGAPSAIRWLLDRHHRALEGIDSYVEQFHTAEAIRGVDHPAEAGGTEDDAPIISVVNLLLIQALRDRASDVHIEPQDECVRVRFRVDGAMLEAASLPRDMASALSSRIKIMAGLNIVERRRPQDGQISTTLEGRELDIRVSIGPTIWGEKVVLRLLDKSRPLFRLSQLGMSEAASENYRALINAPFGMVVCAGPTGSGKTTTLYASLLELNDPVRNITTIEDPVEYVLPSINQIQINPAADITFASGLRSVLRQDPDVILVGEIRDDETARIAVRSALTGHLVLSSIHATDAPSALQRFLEMDIEPFLVSSSVLAVVAQRLVRRICTACRVPYEPSAMERSMFVLAGGGDADFAIGKGCNYCAGTGFRERVGVYEVLTVTDEMRELVLEGGSRAKIRAAAVRYGGMRTLRDEGVRLVSEGVTTIPEVMRTIWALA